jgi:hypothetical protein
MSIGFVKVRILGNQAFDAETPGPVYARRSQDYELTAIRPGPLHE